ncbi:MAG TPA: DUF6599 family protein [Terracidiphilus sp.]|nr:DUF6599 family protein [Terracidiphilus sp.]
MHRAKYFVAITAASMIVAFTAAGCKKTPIDPFPSSGAIAGWQKTSDTRVFAAKNLWQYIDGDADRYIKAGVVSAATSDYKYQDRFDATVDVYQMSDPAGAREILDADRSKEAASVQLADGGIVYEQSVAFRKGAYFVRVVAYQQAPGMQQALLELAHGVETKLPVS